MPSPNSILAYLLGSAIGAAGILHGLHSKATRTPADHNVLENQLRVATEEVEMLKREIESLRSLANGEGAVTVPREFIAHTEKEFALRFLTNPIIHRIAPDELRDRIAASIESRFGPSGIDDRQLAYSLMGWLRPEEDLLTQLTVARAAGADAWFDDVTGEGWMPAKTNLKNIPDQAALVGLLVRILFHQHFPKTPDYPGDDANRAHDALHHGTAAGANARFMLEMARTAGFMPMNENKEAKQFLASLSPFVQGLTNFPDGEGKGHADALYVQGNEALQAVFRNPPLTTAAIMRAGTMAANFIVLEPPVTPEAPFLSESAGQLGLFLRLVQLGDIDSATEIANSWKSDCYVLFPDVGNTSAVVWDIELDSSSKADRLQAMTAKLTATQGGGENEQRYISLVRLSPTRLRFINTANSVTADKLRTP